MVRVPGHAPEAIAAALDSGAHGVLVPRVSTAAQALAAVKASRYPPQGERGVGPGRAAGYGYRISEYLAEANARSSSPCRSRPPKGLPMSRRSPPTDGVDVVFVGPGDLSVSIDAIGPTGADKLAQAIETIIGAALEHGKTAGIFCASPEDVGRWAAKGASFFILASDTMFLGAGAAASQCCAPALTGRDATPVIGLKCIGRGTAANFLSLKLLP